MFRLRFSDGQLRQMTALLAGLVILVSVDVAAQSDSITLSRARSMSLEDLMQVKVVSASRREQSVENTAAAVHVISREDLANSKVRTVAEALRLVPGLQVAQIDANRWAVGARGFSGRYSAKLLVLIDGRSVYSPLFSGVHWGIEDVPLAIIDRIEVIRGPGASVWGSNAVNGVINIITLPAAETKRLGTMLGAGVEENAFGEAWYGTSLGDDVDFRIAAKSFSRDDYFSASPATSHDAWQLHRANMRLDWSESERTDFSLFMDIHGFSADQTLAFSAPTPPYESVYASKFESVGGSLVGRWEHRQSETKSWRFQTYLEAVDRRIFDFGEKRLTWDADLQFDSKLGSRSQMVLGATYRVTSDDLTNLEGVFDFGEEKRTDDMWGAFAQLQVAVVPGHLDFTLGSKVENHFYTASEFQPTARLLWHPVRHHTLWGSASRAVRSPSRAEIGGRYDFGTRFDPGAPPTAVIALGNPQLGSEELVAWELGYRFVPERDFSLDMAVFVNQYDGLRGIIPESVEFFPDPPPGYVLSEARMVNSASATAWGGELSARYQPATWLRLSGFYALFDMDYGEDGAQGHDQTAYHYKHGTLLRSELQLHADWRLDTSFHHHSAVENSDTPAMQRLDMALGWQMQPGFEVALVGQSLLHSHRTEFENAGWELGTEVQRTVFAMVRWNW